MVWHVALSRCHHLWAEMSTINLLPVPCLDYKQSLSTLWSYIHPTLDLIIHSSWDDTSINRNASPVSMQHRMGINTACYNFFTSHFKGGHSAKVWGKDLYKEINNFYAVTAQELVAQLDSMLNTVGIHAHHPLRKELRKLVVQNSDVS